MAICALMLGRDGSRGFPGKNVYPLLARPMMAYPILAARRSRHVDRIYVSTDSPSIRAVAEENGAEVIDRPTELSTHEALGEDAFLHGYRVIQDRLEGEGNTLEFMVLLFCNAPTVSPDLIDAGIDVLRGDAGLDSAVSVSRYNMWSPLRARRIGEDGLLQPFVPFETFGDPASLNCDRDSQGDVWFADMGVSVVRPQCLERMSEGMLPQKWMGRRIYPLIQTGGLDVDYDWQLPMAEEWLRRNGYGADNENTDSAGEP
ncbi:MAG: cytidylyltransferase [Actinomycetota bacterium]